MAGQAGASRPAVLLAVPPCGAWPGSQGARCGLVLGALCGLLEPAGACWGLLEPAGACWGLLEPAGACWGLLGPAGACWSPSPLSSIPAAPQHTRTHKVAAAVPSHAGLPCFTGGWWLPLHAPSSQLLLAALICLVDALEAMSMAKSLAQKHGQKLEASQDITGRGKREEGGTDWRLT